MKKLFKQISAGFLALALVFAAIPPIQASAGTAEPAITGISFENMEVYEGSDGYFLDEGEGTYYYFYNVNNLNYTLKFDDGTSMTRGELSDKYEMDDDYWFNGWSFCYQGVEYEISYQTEQSGEAPWEAGKTYTVPVSVMVYEEDSNSWIEKFASSFSYKIKDVPVESITFAARSVMTGNDGYWSSDWISTEDGGYFSDEYFEYNLENYNYTVTFSDGTEDYVKSEDDQDEDSDSAGFYYDGTYIDIGFFGDQSYDNQWKAGVHQVTVHAGGVSATYDLTIKALPVQEIVFEPKSMIEHTGGFWDQDWNDDDTQTDQYYKYSEYENYAYTVKFSDGTADYVHEEDAEVRGFYYDGEYVELTFRDDQSYANQWKAGGNANTVTVTVGEYKTTYNTEIKKSPVADIEIKDTKIIEHTGGYHSYIWDDEDENVVGYYFHYYINSDIIPYTVVLKDGTKVDCDVNGDVTIDGKTYGCEYNDGQSRTNQWGVGIHEVKVSVLGVEKTFKVQIVCDEHTWDKGTATSAATCTSKGEVTYKCTNNGCTETKTVLVPTTGHSWNKNFTVDKAATCTAAGSKSIHCADCKAVKDVTVIPSSGHTPGAAATCTAPQICTVCQTMLAAPTGHTAGPDATCEAAQNCAACSAELAKVKGHAVALTEKTKATTKEAGKIVETCICGKVMTTSTIAKIKTVKLTKKKYAYTGKAIKPSVTVKDAAGKVLTAGTDYDVTYKNNKKVGKATATVKFKGSYSGTKKLTYKINPAKPTIKKPAAAKKALTAKWGKVSKQITGYEVMVATNKAFTKNKKVVTVKSYKTTSKKITKLKAKKTYYVKVRTYKTVGKVKYYSKWSAVKYVKVK